MNFPINYSFTAEEEKQFWKWAQERFEQNRKWGSTDFLMGKRTNLEIDFDGVISEISIKRMFNLPEIVETKRRERFDVIANRIPHIVKSTRHQFSHLYFPPRQQFDAEFAFLVKIITNRDTSILGWIDRVSFERMKIILNFGYNNVFGIPENCLFTKEFP